MMQALHNAVNSHKTTEALFVFWLASNAISTMPSTADMQRSGYGPKFLLMYGWFHDLLHVMVGNAARVFPGLRAMSQSVPDASTPPIPPLPTTSTAAANAGNVSGGSGSKG